MAKPTIVQEGEDVIWTEMITVGKLQIYTNTALTQFFITHGIKESRTKAVTIVKAILEAKLDKGLTIAMQPETDNIIKMQINPNQDGRVELQKHFGYIVDNVVYGALLDDVIKNGDRSKLG